MQCREQKLKTSSHGSLNETDSDNLFQRQMRKSASCFGPQNSLVTITNNSLWCPLSLTRSSPDSFTMWQWHIFSVISPGLHSWWRSLTGSRWFRSCQSEADRVWPCGQSSEGLSNMSPFHQAVNIQAADSPAPLTFKQWPPH